MQDYLASQSTQHVIEHLQDIWRYPQEPSPDVLRQITEFVIGLEEPYRTIGFQKITEHTISNMSLHILALMAIFQQKAEQEGISLENRDKTFDHIKQEAFQILDALSKNISVQSLDDLAVLSNITVGLQTLSRTDSAQEAQSWLYELPTMYYHQLEQEKLVIKVQHREWEIVKAIAHQSTNFIGWTFHAAIQGPVISVQIPPITLPSKVDHPIPLEPNKILYTSAA